VDEIIYTSINFVHMEMEPSGWLYCYGPLWAGCFLFQ
jgi:hypothetical protein